jgi:hypothetical protein
VNDDLPVDQCKELQDKQIIKTMQQNAALTWSAVAGGRGTQQQQQQHLRQYHKWVQLICRALVYACLPLLSYAPMFTMHMQYDADISTQSTAGAANSVAMPAALCATLPLPPVPSNCRG